MRLATAALLIGLMLAATPAASQSTAERLELLERRVSRITDLTLQLDQLRRENQQLRGEIENLGYEIERLKRKQRDIYLDIDQRLGGLSGGAASPAVTPPATTPGGAPAETIEPVAERAPVANRDRAQVTAEYQAAYALLSPQQKRYAEAAKAFEVFLQKYPGDELAPNAQYWLGEAHYVSQNNAAAQQAFEVVVSRYPDSNKAPGALFKIGRLQQASGDTAAARSSFQRVLDDYPDSPAAGLARQRLDQLGR
jgi:tol-pal system protein YbgF